MKPGPCSARIWETVRNMDRAPLGHPCLEAAPEVEAVAIMIAEKSRGHLEDMDNGEDGCELQHRLATDVLLLH